MSPATVFVRLALIIGVFLQLHQVAASHGAGLMLPGLRQHDTSERVCRSFKICHNSKGHAWTTVQLFSALEPLLNKLQLEPATEYVEVTPLQGCLSSGCCCSSPVEVRFSLPVHRNKQTAAAELASLKEFLQFRLPRALEGTACTSAQLGDCPPELAAERKLLRNAAEDDLPPLPAGLIPYDGKKPAPEFEEEPPKPAASSPQAKPQQPQANKPKVDDSALDLALPEGLIPYDHKTTRQLLEELAEEEAAIAAVPAMTALGVNRGSGAAILESGRPGVYGGAAAAAIGGYGGRALLQAVVGGYGGPSGRNLLEQPAAKPAAPKADQEKKQDTKKQPAPATTPKDSKQPSKSPSTPNSSSISSRAAPCSSSSGISSSSSPNGRPYGTCYCRYNPKDSSWALEQAACRAALFNRCKTAGPLLECSSVEAFYKGLAMPGSEPPHKDTLTAFLFTDCPPAPPCSCRSLVDGAETPTAHSRCCTDLQAHCAAPFSGLDCEDVARFCRPGRQSSDPVGGLFSYVLVKTHGFDCSTPKYAVSYTTVASTSRSVETDAAIRQLSKAAMFEGIMRYDYSQPDRVAALLTMLVGGCFAVLVSAVGVAVIFKIVSARNHHAAPLLERL